MRLPLPSAADGRDTSTPARVVVAAASLLALGIIGARLSFVPIWDGDAFGSCAITAAEESLNPGYLQCFGHPSLVSMGLLALTQLLDPGNAALMHILNACLVAAAAVSFHRILQLAFPAREHALDRALLFSGFVLQPALLANVIQPALDIAVFAGFFVCLGLLLHRRYLATALAGMAFVFTKETGALLYGLLVGGFAFWFIVRRRVPLRQRARDLGPLLVLVVPLMLFAAFLLLFLLHIPSEYPLFQGAQKTSLLRTFLVPRLDAYLAADLTLIFILNFSWIATAVIVADAVVGIGRAVRRQPRRSTEGADPSVIGFLALMAAAMAYLLTRFQTFSHVRYYIYVIPLLLPLMHAAALRFGFRRSMRRAMIATYLMALLASMTRTVDPLSRKIFGTFAFGRHELLRPTSVTGECCAYGLDGLVYNFQFTRFGDLVDDALAAFSPGDSSVIVVPFETNWRIVGALDAGSRRRTLRRSDVVRPVTKDQRQLFETPPLPARAIFLALPNGDSETALRELSAHYTVEAPRRFTRAGYWLDAYQLERR